MVLEEEMDENHEEMEDIENASGDSFIEESNDDDGPSISSEDDAFQLEDDLTEEEIEEIIADLLIVESKAAEAQESLEEESLAKVEVDVRLELAHSLQGEDLDKAVADEMKTYREEWEATLDELETEIAHLLEQLDGAGIELPSLFKWIESQAPNGCSTEVWKKRTHWVGSQVTNDVTECVSHAEEYLQTHRPVRRKLGKVLEEGASGYLGKKSLAAEESSDARIENSDVDWSSFNKILTDRPSAESTTFGSKHWASVYLANTPQQAAELGLKFPGVDEVEQIDDIDDPFVADAIANENELDLSETQKKNLRKVKEEDDANIERKLHVQLKRRRLKYRSKQERYSPVFGEENDLHSEGGQSLKNVPDERIDSEQIKAMGNGDPSFVTETVGSDLSESRGSKRSHNSLEFGTNDKKALNVDPIASQNDKFRCTACDEVAAEVHTHPLLQVIVCQDCRCSIEAKMHVKDHDCTEGYCGWCGGSNELISCKSCDVLFCTSCIKRNLGEECFSNAKLSSWQCCCCIPSILQHLTLQLEKAIGSVEMVSSSDSDSDSSDGDEVVPISSKRKRKKKIRRILDDTELGEETKRKIAIEKERQERLKSLKAHSKSMLMSSGGSNWNLTEGGSIEVLGDALTGYIVNVVREKGEEAVRIPRSISGKLKAHQVAGIRFMWENIIQSVTKAKSGDKGLGCILAHTMGLGKTFQVIAFLYTAMRCVDLGLRTALIVTPVSVLHNWRKEFDKWRPSELKPLRVYMLEDVSSERRSQLLAKWRTKGGIFLISYSAFRNLSLEKLGKRVKDIHIAREISCALQDGPDILVCDEAHTIKNTRAYATQALKQVKCQRRIALTGSPLQNNLMEYYCMVDFVREGFLGSSHEFRNRFQNPIENGQHTNSTLEDVKIMNQRSHILYEELKGFVQRMDMTVMKKDLPSKTVFVVTVKLSSLQRKLYKRFLDVHGFTSGNVSSEKHKKRSFFAGYQALAQISNHPGVLQLTRETKDYGKSDAVEKLLVEESSSDENIDSNMITGEKAGKKNDSVQKKNENAFLYEDWWNDLSKENNYNIIDNGGKMVLLLDILTMSSDVGDKVLVFSQFLSTLDLIEFYLSKMHQLGKKGKCWKRGKDWYRLDGKTESLERQRLVERFNEPSNTRVKCTLISTRAGSLGINLHAANRVVIVDGSWNPTYDLQAIYRAWRYGQKKPVFAYRLLAHGTMEEKIYKRQVTKEGLAARVVDRQQVHRTISKEEMLHLFEFGDDENHDSLSDFGPENGHGIKSGINDQKLPLSHGNCSSDKLMESLLSRHKLRWIANYHEHETLLQENEDEKLSKEEQDMAWEVYRKTFEWEEVQRVPVGDPLVKPTVLKRPSTALENSKVTQTRARIKNRLALRKCTNLSHLLTLRSQGTKEGCSTICGECAQEISWENLNKISS